VSIYQGQDLTGTTPIAWYHDDAGEKQLVRRFLLTIISLVLVSAPSGVVYADDGAPADNSVSNLRVLTLNLRSRLDQPDLREPAISAFLTQTRPDVVLLQEVGNVSGPELTQAHRLAKTAHYEIAACYNPKTYRGLAILARYPVIDVIVQHLPGRRRPALGVVLNIGGRLVSFVNVHLTPQMEAVRQRQRELRAALNLMTQLPGPSFIGGDFNFGDSARENALLSELIDTYRIMEPEAPGHTWDLKNPLARKNSYPEEPSRRLDRILLSDARARVKEAHVVLDEPVMGELFPSDHYGVFARVELFPAAERGGVAPHRRNPGASTGRGVHQPALPRP